MKRCTHIRLAAMLLCATIFAVPLAARDSLGIFGDWGAFRDPDTPRCYAIAKARPSQLRHDNMPFASVGTWPLRKVRGQIFFRLSRNMASKAAITLTLGDRNFALAGSGANAWATGKTMDAAIISAMRSTSKMVIRTTDRQGRRFSSSYDLDGAATAMDAATVGCASIR